MNIEELRQHEQVWRGIIEGKGYNNLNFEVLLEPINNKFDVTLYFYDTAWSSTRPGDGDVKTRGTFDEAESIVNNIDKWIRTVPQEHEAREQRLVRDYAAIKERIAASRLPDIVKAEAEALMISMTTNIIEHKPT